MAKQRIEQIAADYLQKESLFVVDCVWSTSNDISLTIDSMSGVTITQCEELSRIIERELEGEVEDFSLTVASYGISSPFKMEQHYQKNIGKEVEILLKKGEKFKATLLSASPTSFEFSRVPKRVKKGEETNSQVESLEYTDVKSVQLVIKFK